MSDAVRVLLVSWEYPPLVVGGLGRHVGALARELASAGHDVRVVSRGEQERPSRELIDGIQVLRAAHDPLAIDFTTESLLAWSQASEHALLRTALPLIATWRPDIVHAHDWLVAQTAITLSEASGAALVATIHATEAGRHQGWLPRPLNAAIHSVEAWLATRATQVIVCSSAMNDELCTLFGLPSERVSIIGNGIEPRRWSVRTESRDAARTRLGGAGPLVIYAGRLVHEKGIQTMLRALPVLRAHHRELRFVVAGEGAAEPELRALARRLRVARAVQWLGFVDESGLPALLSAADVAILPSLYEPFGISALEAAAVGTPLVVAEVGGLLDLVNAGVAAASFPAGEPEALAAAVTKVLADEVGARRQAAAAARVVRRRYGWRRIAAQTAKVYERAVALN